MSEPREMTAARRRLAEAEGGYREERGLAALVEALGLLDDVIASAAPAHARTARNLVSTYATRIFGRMQAIVAQDAAVPEPELEHFFKLALAFDHVDAALPPSANALKIAVVGRLIERYYEGHSPDEKERALEMLSQLRNAE